MGLEKTIEAGIVISQKWAEDVKNSIELELKELDHEIKAGKTEAKKILNLEEKVKAQRQYIDNKRKLAVFMIFSVHFFMQGQI